MLIKNNNMFQLNLNIIEDYRSYGYFLDWVWKFLGNCEVF